MGLKENIRNERVDQLELREPVTVAPTATVRDALSMMRDRDLGCAVMVDNDRKPIGTFDESMLTKLLSEGPLDIDQPIEKYVTTQFPLVRTTDPIANVLEVMQTRSVRMLFVVDSQDRVVGVTGQRGVMEYVADHFPGQVMVQRIGLPPYYCSREGA